MEKTVLFVPMAILVVVVALIVLGQISKSGHAAGLTEGRLGKCPDKPNCVCSEYADDADHFIAPIPIADPMKDKVFEMLRESIHALGGEIKTDKGAYMAAVFKSGLFGFVDDVEFRIDSEEKRIHVRSASRVGYSDLGANRKRVERLRETLEKKFL